MSKGQCGLKMKYFTLRPESKYHDDIYAEASRKAMLEYARTIEEENQELATDLRKWVRDEEKKQKAFEFISNVVNNDRRNYYKEQNDGYKYSKG